jgi:hypothetical protein
VRFGNTMFYFKPRLLTFPWHRKSLSSPGLESVWYCCKTTILAIKLFSYRVFTILSFIRLKFSL